jgi:Sec-independent protein translocase protein TatA
MLSFGEMVVLAGAAVFFLGRKEGMKMLQTSSKTISRFWKQVAKDGKDASSHKDSASKGSSSSSSDSTPKTKD